MNFASDVAPSTHLDSQLGKEPIAHFDPKLENDLTQLNTLTNQEQVPRPQSTTQQMDQGNQHKQWVRVFKVPMHC